MFPGNSQLSNGIDGIGEYIEAIRINSITKRKFSVTRAGLLGALTYLEERFESDNPKLRYILSHGCSVNIFGMLVATKYYRPLKKQVYELINIHGEIGSKNVYRFPVTKKGMSDIVKTLQLLSSKDNWKHEKIYEYY